ncbi:MAG: hypothetical protein ACT4P4_15450 [Betaproteobacteria bacterium]
MLIRTTLAAAILAFSLSAFAQQRGNTPPGMSTDGARPADGAIQGGRPILPGETAGVPNKEDAALERLDRCRELKGSLGEECLLKERSAAGGSSAPPADKQKDNMGSNGEEPGRYSK